MALAPTLPSISFETVSRPLADELPRMDICGFVGFAATGPVDIPVLVEDPVHFRDVFGPDPVIARRDDGTDVRAHLGAAVEAFFANGGVRAWVVRVAMSGPGGAVTSRHTIPGLIVPGALDGTAGGWATASLSARSPGAWSDGLSAGAVLSVTSAVLTVVDDDQVVVDHRLDVTVGDLIRIELIGSASAVATVRSVGRHNSGRLVGIDAGAAWLIDEEPDTSTLAVGPALRLTADGAVPIPSLAVTPIDGETMLEVDPSDAVESGDDIALEAALPGPTLVLLSAGEERVALVSPDDDTRRFSIGRAIAVSALPAGWATDLSLVADSTLIGEIQRIRLVARVDEEVVGAIDGIGLSPRHPRSVGGLPTDDALYSLLSDLPRLDAGPDIGIEQTEHRPLTELERLAARPRFPLAGSRLETAWLPFGLTTDPSAVRFGPRPADGELDPSATRNGLGEFDASLFVDPALAALGVDTVIGAAYDEAFVQLPPRRLRGLHSLATFDEVTLLALPDAVHTGWDRIEIPPPTPLTAPVLEPPDVGDDGAGLTWSPVGGADSYRLQHDVGVEFTDPRSSTSDDPELVLAEWSGCGRGVYFRVQAVRGTERGPWSNVVGAILPASSFTPCSPLALPEPEPATPPAVEDASVVWRARTAPEAEPWDHLRAIQTSTLRWCAARGDAIAVLALPRSFTVGEANRHVDVLRGALPAFDEDGSPTSHPFLPGGVPRLTDAEADVLGFGALYHPWPVSGRPGVSGVLTPTPPDGAVAGTIARVAIERGAWIAPARRTLAGVVALSRAVDGEGHFDMTMSGVNPLALDPVGFLALTATTMSPVAAIRPINVRRLIALLRRLAQRLGMTLVFDPNDEEFRRLVQMRFERLLMSLYQLGAFAGATPADAFDVSTSDDVNPPAAADAGRFYVEVRIAPAVPLEFIVVRLILSGAADGPEVR